MVEEALLPALGGLAGPLGGFESLELEGRGEGAAAAGGRGGNILPLAAAAKQGAAGPVLRQK